MYSDTRKGIRKVSRVGIDKKFLPDKNSFYPSLIWMTDLEGVGEFKAPRKCSSLIGVEILESNLHHHFS